MPGATNNQDTNELLEIKQADHDIQEAVTDIFWNKPTSQDELSTDAYIERFAKDFGIDYDKYKFNARTNIVSFHCIEASPSEVNHTTIHVPAFIVRKYGDNITTHYTPKTEQQSHIKYRCPSCTRQELILTDGWLICGNLDCKAPDLIDKVISLYEPKKENPDAS